MFLHNYLPNSILFSFGSITLHWYGLILVLAIILSSIYARYFLIKDNILSKKKVEDLFFYLIIFGIIGARLGHVILFNLSYYLNNPLDIFKIWNGGISIQGGVIAGFLVLIYYTKKYNLSFWKLAGYLSPALILGQSIGRWGNYFNQELFGKPTEYFLSIPIALENRVDGYFDYSYFHPTFLYESFLNLLLFLILHFLFRKKKIIDYLFLIYLIGYSLIRFSMEFIRIDPTPIILGLRLPQLLSVLVIIFSLYLLIKKGLPKLKK